MRRRLGSAEKLGEAALRSRLETTVLTVLALLSFAANSILTRFALGSRQIDAASFALIRLAAGAAVLLIVVRAQSGTFAPLRSAGHGALGPLALFGYAVPFSFAYLRIGAAAGALVLFGVVQLTMIGYGILRGERPSPASWLGMLLALTGLAVLTVPAATRPDPLGALLMVVAGVAWAAYSLAGRTSPDAVAANARAFACAIPLALLVSLLFPGTIATSARGVMLAMASGGLTSGLGYVIWYRALPQLTVTQAAVAQLSVPVVAAAGGAVLLGEQLSARLVIAGVAVLSGVALVLAARSRKLAR